MIQQPLKKKSNWRVQMVKRAIFGDRFRQIAPAPFTPRPREWSDREVTLSWLGHSTVLINFFGLTILTDPVLGSRVGVAAGPVVFGPKRRIQPALKYSELPPIDLILLSHCHFDHFDMWTLRRMESSALVVSPKHTSDLLRCTRLKRVREVDWNERIELFAERGGLKIEAFPTKHWGARMGADRHRQWNGYILERNGKKLIFGGDTARSPVFEKLRAKGPFDLAIMPIGAYDPWIHAHCTPEEALEMADAAGAKYILPVHHQTFILSREPLQEPIARMEQALAGAPERLAMRDIGETFVLPK